MVNKNKITSVFSYTNSKNLYIKSGFTRKEAAILRHHRSTVEQSVDLLRVQSNFPLFFWHFWSESMIKGFK